jgi:hypothetical protein
MSKFRKDKRRAQAEPESRRRKNAYSRRMREYLSPNTARPVDPPVVVGPLLSDPAYLSFANFLSLPETRELFGLGNDAANMLSELAQEREFLLLRASKHPKNRARSRRLLADYVRRVYIGDVRGLLYWRRVAKVIWIAYENLLRLKLWAARTRDGEMARMARWQARAAKERDRQRARRESARRKRAKIPPLAIRRRRRPV